MGEGGRVMVAVPMAFLAIFSFTLVVGELFHSRRRRIVARLERLSAGDLQEKDEILSLPFRERIILPGLAKLGRLAAGFTPRQINANLERRLAMAGPSYRQRSDLFLSLRGIILLGLPGLTLTAALWARLSLLRLVLWTLLALVAAILLPLALLEMVIRRRQAEIQRSLPNVLDLLVVSVEAGLGFDSALLRVTEKLKGTLADEFRHTLNEMRLGRVRREALRDLASRTGVYDFNIFISAVIQADQLGVSVADVLRVQADTIRGKRREHFREAAQKAPVKMLFPLIFLIFPALFLVIMGPAIIQIMKTFGGM